MLALEFGVGDLVERDPVELQLGVFGDSLNLFARQFHTCIDRIERKVWQRIEDDQVVLAHNVEYHVRFLRHQRFQDALDLGILEDLDLVLLRHLLDDALDVSLRVHQVDLALEAESGAFLEVAAGGRV